MLVDFPYYHHLTSESVFEYKKLFLNIKKGNTQMAIFNVGNIEMAIFNIRKPKLAVFNFRKISVFFSLTVKFD